MRRSGFRALAVAAVLAGTAVAACGEEPSAQQKGASRPPEGERPDGVRKCAQRIETGRPGPFEVDRRRDLRIGPVVFSGLRRPRGQMTPPRPGSDRGLKSATVVRAGAPVFLRIPPKARSDIALAYGVERDGTHPDVRRVAQGQVLVRVEPCPPRTRRFSGRGRVGRWTAFSGGFVFRARGCYPVEVARRGKPFVRRMVAFGKRC